MAYDPFGSGDLGASPFDDIFARFFGGAAPQRPAQRIDIGQLMTEQARELVRDAATQAARWGDPDLDTDHLLWAATRQEPVRRLLTAAGADPDHIARNIEAGAKRGEPREEAPSLTPSAKRALLDARQVSRAFGSSYIGPEHLLFALAVNPESAAGRQLRDARVTPETLQEAAAGGGPGAAGGQPPSDTPTLDEYSTDLTAMARDDRIDPVIGRESEIEQTIEVLSRRTKNNPVLIGEPGVGKTAIAEGIAQRIVDGDVPDTLRDKRLVRLDLAGLVAGTRYRGDFEERLKKVIDEITAHSDELIVFIDELHTVVGAGAGEGAMNAGNMLKPALARGELHIVGATTIDEYRKDIEKDAALERRFQPILVPEPSVSDTIEILRGLRDRYEAHHQVRFTDEALVAAAQLSDRYITDRFLPDKAIDLIDQAGARVRLRTKRPAKDRRELEQRLDQLHREKDQAVAAEDYDRAGSLRDEIAELTDRVDGAAERGRRRGRPEERARGRHGRHRRGRLPLDRHPGRAAHPGGAGTAPRARGEPAPAGHRPGRRGDGDRRGGPALAGRARRPEPAHRQLPVPRADRRRQDRAGAGAGRGAVRQRGPDDPDRHERVPGAAHRQPPGRRPSRLRRLRGGGPAHRGGPPDPVRGPAARRDREGERGCVQHPAAGARRRPADRRPGPHGRLQEHGRDHDQQPRLGRDRAAQARLRRRRRRGPEREPGRAGAGSDHEQAARGVPAGVPQPDRRDHRLPSAR